MSERTIFKREYGRAVVLDGEAQVKCRHKLEERGDGLYEVPVGLPSLSKELAGELDRVQNEVASVLMLMDQLAEQWGDEGVFRRCRDRLRAILPATKE